MIKNNSETTPLNLDLFPVSGKPVELSFSGEKAKLAESRVKNITQPTITNDQKMKKREERYLF
ncbi:hypothetical protein ES705_05155 [subsurface metagenome]